jgi:predicted amidohydrolase YtcJ
MADFVILSEDIMTVEADEIANIAVEQVYLDGVKKK